jgi:hypothetical protein
VFVFYLPIYTASCYRILKCVIELLFLQAEALTKHNKILDFKLSPCSNVAGNLLGCSPECGV